MPKDAPGSSRQRPVSCGFCRKRKLRCSRNAPCSNCVSRSVHCDLEDIIESSQAQEHTASQVQILDRLDRLEALLASAQRSDQLIQRSTSSLPQSSEAKLLPSSTKAAELSQLDQDVALLESIYLDDHSSTNGDIPLNCLLIKTCSIKDMHMAKSYLCLHELALPVNSLPVRCIWLPKYSEAQMLLQKFICVAAHYPWVTHIAALPTAMEAAYETLRQRRQIKPGLLILLLSIFACAANSWTSQDCGAHTPYSSATKANDQINFWATAAIDVMNLSRDHTTLPIEAIQGLVILAFLLIKLEGLSRRCRFLFSTCFHMSRDLGLHRIDHPSNPGPTDTVEAEMGRRVFWYLCASDWQAAARFDGVQGTYTWHPRQIITRKPRHIDDEDMLVEQPMSTPTTMSYPLHRIKISEICRNLVDRRPLASAHLGCYSSDELEDIDLEFQTLLNEVQPFFAMSQDELIARHRLRTDKAADIVQQGHTLRFLLHSQRCKIHLPYLTKGYTMREYKYSRTRCIESARLLIQSQFHLFEAGAMNGTLFPFTGLILGVFMASIVLFVDLCMKKSPEQGTLHRTEVSQALRMLESAKDESATTAHFVESLTAILRKHKVTPVKHTLSSTLGHVSDTAQDVQETSAAETSNPLSTPGSLAYTALSNSQAMIEGTSDEDLSAYFQDLAQSFEQGLSSNQYDWDNILSDLNASFV